MAHMLTHAPRNQAGLYLPERPNPARIAAYSGVIAIHAAALMLLLMPMAAPVPPASKDEVTEIKDWITKPKILEIPIAPPTHQKPKPVMTPRPTTTPTVRAPIDDAPVLSTTGEQVAEVVGPVDDSAHDVVEQPSIAAVRLEYANAPAPAYPREELRRRIEGTVLLQVLVDVDGRPLDVLVQQSSGNRRLDEAARLQVLKRWTFRPAMQNGVAIQAMGLVPVVFKVQ
jgi:periplasmic protein TonB